MKTERKKSVFPDCYLWLISFTYSLAFVFNLLIFAFLFNQAISKMNSFTVLLPPIRVLGFILLSFCFFSASIIVYMWNSLFIEKLKQIRTGIVMMSVLLVLNLVMCMITGLFLIFSTYKSSEDKMMNTIVNYHPEEKNVENIDALQQELQCCGVDNYMDWRFNKKYKCLATGTVPSKCGVPASCCKPIKEFPIDENCGIGVLNKPELTARQWNETMGNYERVYNLRSKAAAPEIINTNGCKEGIINHLHKSGINMIMLTLALIVLQTICIYFQCRAMHYFIKRRRLLKCPSAVFYRARSSDVFIVSRSPELSSGAKQSDETESPKNNHNTSLSTYTGVSIPTKSSKTCFNFKKSDKVSHSTSIEASLKEKPSLDSFTSKKSAMFFKSQSSDLFIDARISDVFHDSTQSESKMLRPEPPKNRMHESRPSRNCARSKDCLVTLKDKMSLFGQNESLAFRLRSPMNSTRVKNILAPSKDKKSQLKSSNYTIEENISTPSKFEIEQQEPLRCTKEGNILPSSKAERNELEIFRKYSGTGYDLVPSNVKINKGKSSINCTVAKSVSSQTEAETSLPGTSRNYSSVEYVFEPRNAEMMRTKAGKSCTDEENTVLSLKIKTSQSEISTRHSGTQTEDEICQPRKWDSCNGKAYI